ncbi:hypothetical protein ACP4OV_008454 [Aristida adscensionis]
MLTLPQLPPSCFHFRSRSVHSSVKHEPLKQLPRSPARWISSIDSFPHKRIPIPFKVITKAVAEQPDRSAAPSTVGDKRPTAGERLQRLELLLAKTHSAVEAAEKHGVQNNTQLVQWRDKLKKAASEGDQVLPSFRQRAMDAQAISKAQPGAFSFTKHALSGMAQGTHNAANVLFSSDEDTKRLDTAVEKLEHLSPEVGEFIRLLRLEILPKTDDNALIRCASHCSDLPLRFTPVPWIRIMRRRPVEGRLGRIKEAILEETRSEVSGGTARRRPTEPWIAETPEYKDYQAWAALLRKITSTQELGGRVGWGVRTMARAGVEDSAALAQWAAVLGEAEQRRMGVLVEVHRYLRKYTSFSDGDGDGDSDGEEAQCAVGEDEVESLVRSLEILGSEVDCFGSLVELAVSVDPEVRGGPALIAQLDM